MNRPIWPALGKTRANTIFCGAGAPAASDSKATTASAEIRMGAFYARGPGGEPRFSAVSKRNVRRSINTGQTRLQCAIVLLTTINSQHLFHFRAKTRV